MILLKKTPVIKLNIRRENYPIWFHCCVSTGLEVISRGVEKIQEKIQEFSRFKKTLFETLHFKVNLGEPNAGVQRMGRSNPSWRRFPLHYSRAKPLSRTVVREKISKFVPYITHFERIYYIRK